MKKRVTMKEIAERLNLSVNAVSLALNDRAGVSEETRRLVLNAAEEMGYLDQSTKYTAAYSNKNICILLICSSMDGFCWDWRKRQRRPGMICLLIPSRRIRRYRPVWNSRRCRD